MGGGGGGRGGFRADTRLPLAMGCDTPPPCPSAASFRCPWRAPQVNTPCQALHLMAPALRRSRATGCQAARHTLPASVSKKGEDAQQHATARSIPAAPSLRTSWHSPPADANQRSRSQAAVFVHMRQQLCLRHRPPHENTPQGQMPAHAKQQPPCHEGHPYKVQGGLPAPAFSGCC